MQIEHTIEINAPMETVWSIFTDLLSVLMLEELKYASENPATEMPLED